MFGWARANFGYFLAGQQLALGIQTGT